MGKTIVNLTDKELTAFKTIKKGGSLSVEEISQRSGLKRTTIYNFIGRLSEKGLIGTAANNGRRFYFPLKREVTLEDFPSGGTGDLKILTAIYLIKKAIWRSLKTKDNQIFWLADSKTTTELFGNAFLEKYIETAKEKGLVLKTLRSAVSAGHHKYHSLEAIRKLGRIVRLGQSAARVRATIVIYDQTILIISPIGRGLAYEITDSELADSFKNIFALIWKYAKTLNTDI